MSKKKRKQSAPQIIKQEISVQDDPYWKVSGIYMDAQRVGRFIARLKRFDDEHTEWTDDIMNGVPTYYCVLGVSKGATKEKIEKAYKRKLEFSSYPDEVIEEAFGALSDPVLQKEYDELLFVFEQITKSMLVTEKNELIKRHSEFINTEKDFDRMKQILDNTYKGHHLLYRHGAPDLYELAGFAKDATFEEIKKRCEAGSELLNRICSIFTNSNLRKDYNFMMDFTVKYASEEILKEREKKKEKWKNINKSILERLILIALSAPDSLEKYMRRYEDILNSNHDWKQYLSSETFLSILGLNRSSFAGDKKDIEAAVREKYRPIEKTPKVNLAYSVLKNAAQRDDYLWLLDNHEMLDALADLFEEEEEEKAPEETKQKKIPSTQELLDALLKLFAKEKKAPKRA